MTTRAWGNEYRTTTVCIDSYENGVLTGRFYNSFMDGGKEFDSLMHFLLELDQTLDDMAFPQSFSAARTFAPTPRDREEGPETDFRTGKLATFSVRIIFRQNASWQGAVTWLEGGKEQSFRSALELLFLMDSALLQANEQVS